MPEGHTIHRLARDQGRLLVGRTVAVSSPQGRFTEGAAELDGLVLDRIEPYGKHLFYRFDRDRLAHVHLGLFGKFRVHDGPPPEPQGAVRMRLSTRDATIDLAGPTDCSLVTAVERAAILARLGPDPLRADADPAAALRRITGSRAPIGTLLLDQSVLAGVGNVFRAEGLFVLGIHPGRPGRDLDPGEADALWATLRAMLRDGVRANRIVTVRPAEVGARSRSHVPRREATYVYKRARCLRCDTPIRTLELANRTCYYCPRCQPA